MKQIKFRVAALAIAILSAIIGTPCWAASAARIVLLESFDVPVVLAHTKFFVEAMGKLGYGKEQIEVLKAEGDPAIAQRLLVKAIDQARPDVIVANATLASKVSYSVAKARHGIPVVFFVVSDPVGAGLVSKINAPSNDIITGVVHSVPRDVKIEMVMRVLEPLKPKDRPVRFGYVHTTYPSAVGDLKMLNQVASKRGDLEFIPYQIPYDAKRFNINRSVKQLIKGADSIDSKIDYWWISHDPVGEQDAFVKAVVERSKHPVIYGTNMASAKSGSLLYIAADTESGATETASMVDAIVRGKAAGTIPSHSPPRIDFGVNLTTAVRLGIAIPSDLLRLAGQKTFR